MKKLILSYTLLGAMVVTLAGCASGPQPASSTTTTTEESTSMQPAPTTVQQTTTTSQ